MFRLSVALFPVRSLRFRGLAGGEAGSVGLLGLVCGVLFFYGIDRSELWRTEGLRARVAAEMLESGDWVVPRLYGEPLLTKPPGMYAAIALASWPVGQVTDWSARLPSAFAATLTVFLFYWTFRRVLGRDAARVAALILPTSLVWLERVPSAEIDLLQLAWVTAALLFFLRGLEAVEAVEEADSTRAEGEGPAAGSSQPAGSRRLEESSIGRPSWRKPRFALALGWVAALLCVLGGFLTKWTAPAFFYGTVLPLLWWRGRLRLLVGWPHLLGLAVSAGLALAWAGAAASRVGWSVLYQTVQLEAAHHLVPGQRAGSYPWGETLVFPAIILAANLPWSVFALLSVRPGFATGWGEPARRLLQLLHCWAWPGLVFWSVIPGHSARHSFPLTPALAGLAAFVWIGWLCRPWASAGAGPRPRWPRRVFFSLLVAWLAIKLVFVEVVVPARMRDRQPRAKAEQLAAVVPAGHALYLCGLKDEGIMFYYGRPVRRLAGPGQLPSSAGPHYVIVTTAELGRWKPSLSEEVLSLTDQQGEPIVLLRVWGGSSRRVSP